MNRPTRERRPRPSPMQGDVGQVGGIEVLPFGLLIFISVTLLFVNVWGVIDAKLAVTSAAREGARAFAESDDSASARAAAITRATETLAAFGRSDERAAIADPVLAAPFGRCVRATITVTYDVPAITIPFLREMGHITTVESSFTEVVDPFRDGLRGPARC